MAALGCPPEGCSSCARGYTSLDSNHSTLSLGCMKAGTVIADIVDASLAAADKAAPWLFKRDPGMCAETEIPEGEECILDKPFMLTSLRRRCLGLPLCDVTPEMMLEDFGDVLPCGARMMYQLSAIARCQSIGEPVKLKNAQSDKSSDAFGAVHLESRVARQLRIAPSTAAHMRALYANSISHGCNGTASNLKAGCAVRVGIFKLDGVPYGDLTNSHGAALKIHWMATTLILGDASDGVGLNTWQFRVSSAGGQNRLGAESRYWQYGGFFSVTTDSFDEEFCTTPECDLSTCKKDQCIVHVNLEAKARYLVQVYGLTRGVKASAVVTLEYKPPRQCKYRSCKVIGDLSTCTMLDVDEMPWFVVDAKGEFPEFECDTPHLAEVVQARFHPESMHIKGYSLIMQHTFYSCAVSFLLFPPPNNILCKVLTSFEAFVMICVLHIFCKQSFIIVVVHRHTRQLKFVSLSERCHFI